MAFHSLRVGVTTGPRKTKSTNPQAQSQQQDKYLSKSLESNSLVGAHACGKVGKVAKPVFVDLEIHREPCRLQVYSSWEVAERMVIALKDKMGILGEVVHCPTCRSVHVVESR